MNLSETIRRDISKLFENRAEVTIDLKPMREALRNKVVTMAQRSREHFILDNQEITVSSDLAEKIKEMVHKRDPRYRF